MGSGVQQLGFPTVEDIMTLARVYVNDMFKGKTGTPGEGRILTDDSPLTLPLLNSALRTIQRKLRNEGVTFPIKDGIVIYDLPPVAQPDPAVFVSLGFDGFNNGTANYGNIRLPGDCVQPQVVRQRVTGSNLQFTPMVQAQEGLPSGYQNQWLGMWEWRGYAIWMNGSTQAQDIMLRYTSGQPPISAPAAQFPTTPVYIIDCQEAMAGLIAVEFGAGRGADPMVVQFREQKTEEALSDMAEEYIRRGQTVNYQRVSYQGGGSNNTSDDTGGLGSVGVAN